MVPSRGVGSKSTNALVGGLLQTSSSSADDTRALKNVQWVYLAIACFVFLLAVVFYFSPIPEITDADMAFQAEETHSNTDIKPFRKQYRLFHAAFAQFCYTGAQVAIGTYSLSN